MGFKYVIPNDNHTTVMVSRETHTILKSISKQEKLPISTIVYYLLKLGLKSYNGIELTGKDMIGHSDSEYPQ